MEKYLLCLFLISAVKAQGNLNSFTSIRAALLEGSEIQLNAHGTDCQVDNVEETFTISMPLAHWQLLTLPDGSEEIRSDEYSIWADSGIETQYLFRTINIYEDDSVHLTWTVSSFGFDDPRQARMDCVLGIGARVHQIIPGNDLSMIDTYEELKTNLLFGSHVEAVGHLGQCSNADLVFQDGTDLSLGYQIRLFEVINDGTPDEFLRFFDVSLESEAGENFWFRAEEITVTKDDLVNVTVKVFEANLVDELVSYTLECQLGSSVRFTLHQREQDLAYTDYESLKEATISGHDMELVAFMEACEVVEGDTLPVDMVGLISSMRFDNFLLIAGETVEEETLSFSTWVVDVNKRFFGTSINVHPDGSLFIDYSLIDVAGGQIFNGIYSCPLQQASVFHGVTRTREPVSNFTEIATAIKDIGQIYETEVDFDLCEGPGSGGGRLTGHIAWQTFLYEPTTGAEMAFLLAMEFSAVKQNITGTPGLAWSAAQIGLLEDNTVQIFYYMYDWLTGVNLLPVSEDPIICPLGTAVNFYKYP